MKSEDIQSVTISRRRLLQYGAAASAALALPWVSGCGERPATTSGPLKKYLEPLPVPGAGLVVATPSGANSYSFRQTPIKRQLHPQLAATPLWAYDDGSGLKGQVGSFGMVVIAHRGTPLQIHYTNQLPVTYPAWIPVDTRLTPRANQVRVMTHLHGGVVAATSDGNPMVTPNGFGQGQTQTVTYPNQQAATLLWFHDHGLGVTRLNVFAGLAAAYLLRDQYDTGTADNANGLPSGAYEIPLVIQDRQFNPDGTFRYPKSDIAGATWIGEYFGDVMLVNGKIWPYLNVEPRLYRFRVLNGCNARILALGIPGATMWQIGAEGGMWDQPVRVETLALAPAERADVLVDFGPLAGETITVTNAELPDPISSPAPSLADVLQIRVKAGASLKPTIPSTLVGGVKPNLPEPPKNKVRYLTLNEVEPQTARWWLNMNGLHLDAPVQENPVAGTVEDWCYVNLTGDTHPIHTHLVMAQVIGRTPFDVDAYQAAASKAGKNGPNGVLGGLDPTQFAKGPMRPAAPAERGFKDTVMAHPEYVTRVRIRFDLPTGVAAPQQYVYHCHIVEHEDNDMMRPFTVTS